MPLTLNLEFLEGGRGVKLKILLWRGVDINCSTTADFNCPWMVHQVTPSIF